MFTISKQVIDWNGELYSIKRVIKETSIKNNKKSAKKYKYKKPKITIYNDMKKILISDPIHDIPEKYSWPKKKINIK